LKGVDGDKLNIDMKETILMSMDMKAGYENGRTEKKKEWPRRDLNSCAKWPLFGSDCHGKFQKVSNLAEPLQL